MPELLLDHRVRSCLDSQRCAGLAGIRVTVEGGTVILQGRVPTYYVKQQVQEFVKHVPGVLQIVNQIAVQG